jgi:hypothetical protein
MTEERRKQWMAVFEWFQHQTGTPELDSLWTLLNELLQQDRQDLEQDPEFQRFMEDISVLRRRILEGGKLLHDVRERHSAYPLRRASHSA